MDEQKWLTANDTLEMVKQLKGSSVRKLLLFGCAVARTAGGFYYPCDTSEETVIVVEQFADGKIGRKKYERQLRKDGDPELVITDQTGFKLATTCVTSHTVLKQDAKASKLLAGLLRDIFGNPFRPVAFDPRWRSESAVALARTAYDTRDFALLPILADALEEAGCDHPDVLTHCRKPNAVHVRGCWVVDGVLGKT